jgi:hypothetical protein
LGSHNGKGREAYSALGFQHYREAGTGVAPNNQDRDLARSASHAVDHFAPVFSAGIRAPVAVGSTQ